MTQLRHIEIEDDKVIFVYYEREEPKREDFHTERSYRDELEYYEASKRSVEVENINWKIKSETAIVIEKLEDRYPIEIKHNQPCEAEIENRIALIIKII